MAAPAPALAKKLSAAAAAKSRNNHASFEMLIQPPPPSLRRAGRRDVVVYSDFGPIPPGRYRSCCLSICAWACIGIFTLTIFFLLIGISCLVFLRSSLPSVNIFQLQVDNSQQVDSFLELELAVSNQNQKLELIYGDLAIDVASEGLKLGKKEILGFRQNPQNETLFDVQMKLVNAGGNSKGVGDIQSESSDDHEEAVFNVYLSGSIGFEFETFHMITVPFSSACYEVKQTDVRLGRKPKCHVRMFAFRPSAN